MAAGLYATRWGDSSGQERKYLVALASLLRDDDHVTGAMVAAHLGRTPKSLSGVCERLIQKGTLYAEGSAIRFSVPGMAAWVHQSAITAP
jgi:hypothetical protein